MPSRSQQISRTALAAVLTTTVDQSHQTSQTNAPTRWKLVFPCPGTGPNGRRLKCLGGVALRPSNRKRRDWWIAANVQPHSGRPVFNRTTRAGLRTTTRLSKSNHFAAT
ncbi:hypothetical protein RB3012 [Rhodopirellula baltica SH 1]|uniref:Uncharacterized protein n=1 Tax=Rhodopirellula baltica (strain DSM 10527 / NCIMB 13988 / SH1) TaxID=243090 RepID=Q7UUW8_RHOBA|nr:hypothetical protein RB3012 [Rhodopirellula baltica SH 1]